jgi:hypothetical protein
MINDAQSERDEARHIVFSGALRVDRLARIEMEGIAADLDSLSAQTHQVHLYRRFRFVPARAMEESIEDEVVVELPVQTRQKVEIEPRRHACAVVIMRI